MHGVSGTCCCHLLFRTWMETERGSGEDFAPLFFHTVFLVWFPEGLQRRPPAVGLEVSPQWHTHLRGEQMAAGGEGSSPLPPPAPASPEPQGKRPAWRDRSPAELGSSTHESFAELKSAFCKYWWAWPRALLVCRPRECRPCAAPARPSVVCALISY